MVTIFCCYLISVSSFCLNVSGSVTRLYQRKLANNVKHASVHLSPVYGGSVSELAKPLNVSDCLFQ